MRKPAPSKSVSGDPLRMRLFRDLVLLILATVGILATASALLINDIKRDFAKARLQADSALVRDEVNGLLSPVAQQLLILRDGLRNRGLTPADVQELNEQLMPPLAHMGQIAGAVFADAAGQEYFLRLDGARWITRERPASPETAASKATTLIISEWLNDDERINSKQDTSTHDPRQRPWFQAAAQQVHDQQGRQLRGDGAGSASDREGPEPRPQSSPQSNHESSPDSGMPPAMDANASDHSGSSPSGTRPAARAQVSWSLPYRFASLDEPGITVSTAWREDGELLVLALDVTLARIIATIDKLQANSAGQGFLFDREGGIYGSALNGETAEYAASTDGRQSRGASGAGLAARRFYNAEQQVGSASVFEAIAAWRAAGEPEDRPIRFESGGRYWWAGFVPLEPAKRTAWVGVTYPSAGPFALLRQRWPVFAGAALAILTLGIGLAFLVVRRYSHRLRDLPKLSIDSAQPETELYDLIGRGESAHLEFKSTMRLNLRSGKNDKAIELAWLKGVAAFLNSEGGILLLGVADDGEVLGLAGDGFANDDKCLLHFKNLVNQHLGAEAMRHLRFRLFQLDDKQIGAVECEAATGPVYLRPGNGESFLIRTGPSNSELPISRALSYIESRF
jgi:hypothetical protein